MRSAAPAARSKSWASPVPCSGSMPKNPTPPARRTSGQAKLLVRKAPARNRQEEEEGSQGSEEARGEGNVARRGPRPGRLAGASAFLLERLVRDLPLATHAHQG